MADDRVKETLFIETWYSVCGNCGEQTLPEPETHEKISGYGGGKPGCGIRWKYVSTHYAQIDKSIVTNIRPDLEYWEYWEYRG